MNSILSYYYKSVTRGRRGRGLSCTFLKIGRSALILRKSVLILVIFGLNFSIKMRKLKFLSFSRGKSSEYFLFDLTFLSFWWNVCQSAIIQRKLPCPDKFLIMRLYYDDLSVDCSTKESIHRFFSRAIWKNHENAKCLDFHFHNHKFSQRTYFGPFMLLQPLIYV